MLGKNEPYNCITLETSSGRVTLVAGKSYEVVLNMGSRFKTLRGVFKWAKYRNAVLTFDVEGASELTSFNYRIVHSVKEL